MNTKGVILCGGKGTRMLPATRMINKHMIPILNKPMILYPLQTLIGMGVKDILIISGGNHIGDFAEFLGDGSEYGVNLTYKVQKEAGGIAQALLLAEDFVDDDFVVILGDNYFEGTFTLPEKGICQFVTKSVADPERFGVYYEGIIEEKPVNPKSNKAVTGIYLYTKDIFEFIKTLQPSARGELEITDVNNWCLQNTDTNIIDMWGFWSDMGTPESMLATIKHLHG
jgi:glucose-1-phosphate thymidylyltransferase